MPAQASRLRRILGTAPLHEGIGLNFVTNRFYTRAPGSGANNAPFTTLFPFTGGNQSLYRGASGLLVQSVTNTPRIEYDFVGTVLGFLSEASRTNLCLQSQDLTTTWTTITSSVSANSIAAPDGTVTADKIVEDSTAGVKHSVTQSLVKAASTLQYAGSAYFKAAGRNFAFVKLSSATGDGRASVDLTTGTLGVVVGTGATAFTALSAVVTPFANGWYKLTLMATSDALAALIIEIGPDVDNDPTVLTYNGDGTSGVYAWGTQIEQAAFASSYIPTTTVSIARTADVSTRTLGAEFSATQGTVVVTARAGGGQDSVRQPLCSFDDGTAANRIPLVRPAATDSIQLRIDTASINQAAIGATLTNSTNYKVAAAWAANDAQLAFAGVLGVQDTIVTLPTVTILGLGYESGSVTQANGHIRTFDYYPTRKPDSFLVSAST